MQLHFYYGCDTINRKSIIKEYQMEFTKEVQSVFQTVMKFQNKDSILIELADFESGKALRYDVTNYEEGHRRIFVDGISVIVDEETDAALERIRFFVEDGAIALERIGGCEGCCGCEK